MSARIAIDDLRVGMFVHLDLGWWAHPFALSSFRLATADQIATIRGLGLTHVRWSPEKSALDPADEGVGVRKSAAAPDALGAGVSADDPRADAPRAEGPSDARVAGGPVVDASAVAAPAVASSAAAAPAVAATTAAAPAALVPAAEVPVAPAAPPDAVALAVGRPVAAPEKGSAPRDEAAAATGRGAGAPGRSVGRAHPVDANAAPDRRAHDRRTLLAAQREATRVCLRQYGEAAKSLKLTIDNVFSQPEAARQATEGLTRALIGKMMVDGELSIRVLADARADRASAHALNVALISMLMGRVFGFGEVEMLDVGVGALLHDVGKLELPERVRHPDARTPAADQLLYREHVVRGLAIGKRMGLSAGALVVIGQHHEMADGSGFPSQIGVDRMAAAARIVALVNRFDNLCDPALPAHALTPHEALSLIFAQTRAKFDASMLNAFIRMMGVYPPGSVVQLTDDRYALVTNVNSTRPLKPRVLVYDPQLPADEALQLNLEQYGDLGIRRSLRPEQLPDDALHYLSPQRRVIYFFEPAQGLRSDFGQEIAA
ncbi:MAG: hypothetical protein LKCHEGNO_01069 [Burkholderiaceae bacterium]|nr:hypothetical protein [Burkholderiaceae bacterium]